MMHEFNLIEHFFNQNTTNRSDVLLGIGDDCALVEVPHDHTLVVTTDTLVEGVHFFKDSDAENLGFKSLAVNLSDLAAMGATPAWFTLALTIPEANENWLKAFSRGLFQLANQYSIQLIGGDLTKGPLTITIQAHGFQPKNQALCRNLAKQGDFIYVTHTLGDAALALRFLQGKVNLNEKNKTFLLNRLNRPEPQIAIGEKLRGKAHAAIDISDGLAADLGHILEKSKVGAVVYVDQLPLSDALLESVSREEGISLALNGGDDYELCFTAAKDKTFEFNCTCIGEITDTGTLVLENNGKKYSGTLYGYQHF